MTDTSNMPPTASRVVHFVERLCTHTKGKWAGKPFILHPWQVKAILKIYGPVKANGHRVVDHAYIEIGKKNGKSELGAALALYHLLADGEKSAEVYIAAAARKQAEGIFKVCAQMVRNQPAMAKLVTIYDTTKTIVMKDAPLSFIRALSADADTEDGINPSCVIFDELHRQKTRKLWAVLDQGMTAREQPIMICLTTAGVEADSPVCWEQHQLALESVNHPDADPSFVGIVYALDQEEDPWKEENWVKANPALTGGDLAFKSWDQLKKMAAKAKKIPSLENDFRRFQLSQWTSSEERWIPLHLWDHPEMSQPFNIQDFRGQMCFAGLDLSSVGDVSAFTLMFPDSDWDTITLFAKLWLPAHGLMDRVEKEKVPWDKWATMGLVELIHGKSIDPRVIRRDIRNLGEMFQISEIAYDPWGVQLRVEHELEEDGFTMVKFTQSFKSYNPAMKAFERACLDHKIRHGGNPAIRWMVDCVSIKRNNFDEIAPVKPDRGKTRSRIDGVVAAVMGLDRLERHRPEDLEGFLADPVIVG